MQQLYPVTREVVDPAAVYEDPRRRASRDLPYVFVNMVASVDGATVVDGVTQELGNAADRHIFLLLRSLADVIVVGAETVRAEGYGPPKVRSEFAAGRAARGQAELPRIAVVTRSLDLDWTSPLFIDDSSRPFVLTPSDADADAARQAAAVADVIRVGTGSVSMPDALRELARRGVRSVLCEGGPTLNAGLLQDGLVDELCLTVSPNLVGAGGGATIMGAAKTPAMVGLELAHVLEDAGSLFLRYLLPRPATA